MVSYIYKSKFPWSLFLCIQPDNLIFIPIFFSFSSEQLCVLYLFILFYCIFISLNTFLIKCNFIGCALVRDRLSIEFEKVFIFS